MAFLIAAFEWTVVAAAAVTGATAVSVGLLGLYQSRLTASVAKHQIEGEMARLREQHRESHFKRRQGVYHDALNHERKFEGMVYGKTPVDHDRFVEWQLSFLDHVNGIVLFGNEEVARCAINLQAVQGELNDLIEKQAGELPTRIQSAYAATAEARTRARRALIDAMRRDIASDREVLSRWPDLPDKYPVRVEGSTDPS